MDCRIKDKDIKTNIGRISIDSQVVDFLRFPLSVMVICIHCYIPNESNYLIVLLSHVLSHIAVPLFFIISGYFFFNKLQNWDYNIWIEKIYKRSKTLLLPYILWILLFIIYSFLPNFIKGIVYGEQVSIVSYFISNDSLHMFWDSYKWNVDRMDLWGNTAINTAPILVPFWFMRDLIVVDVLSPIFYYLLKPRKSIIGRLFPMITIIFLGLLYFTSTSLIIPGFSTVSFFFFGIGAYLQLHNKNIVPSFSKYKLFMGITACVLLCLNIIYDGNNTTVGCYIYKPWVLIGVCVALYLSRKLVVKQSIFVLWLKRMNDTTFFLFAIHAFLIPYIKSFFNMVIGRLLDEGEVFTVPFSCNYPILYTLIYILLIITTTLFSILIFKFCQKFMPKTCGILTGR